MCRNDGIGSGKEGGIMNAKKIQMLDSGIYTAKDADGVEVIIMRQKGEGWSIKTPTHNGWFEVAYYGETGEPEGVGYERA